MVSGMIYDIEKGIYKKYSFLRDQVEVSETTNKLILPISVQETSSQTIYRKNPENKKTIIKGKNSNGIEEFFSTGDMLGTVLKDVFADINIYDDCSSSVSSVRSVTMPSHFINII